MSRTMVIAEIGSCHDGELEKAYRLIETAKAAGADVVKAQYWSSAERMVERRKAPEYLEVYRAYQTPKAWLPLLRERCEAVGVQFACSSYLPEDVWTVAQQTDIMKIASFEANDEEHLAQHAWWLQKRKTVIVSLGLGADGIKACRALGWAYQEAALDGLRFLHCVSSYPAPVDQLALSRIARLRGYSDHSVAHLETMGALAVAAGARIIERHIRLDDTSPDNPDASCGMSPAGFQRYVDAIRQAEAAMGDGSCGMQPCETDMARYRVGA